MENAQKQAPPVDGYSEDRPFHIHIENSRNLQPVFIVREDQCQEALARHPDVAARVRVTMGFDGDIYDDVIGRTDAMVTYRFPHRKLAAQAPNMKWIQVLGAGVDYLLPLDWLPAGVQLTTNHGAHVPKAAQSGLMAILMVHGQLPRLAHNQRNRRWERIFTPVVAGRTLLVVGVGHIGGGIATQAKQLGMKVLGIRASGRPHPDVDEMHGIDALMALLPRADIVILNAALTPGTKTMIGKEQFDAMKPGAGFINMSRGELVDSEALDAALRSGHLSSALIDVAHPEPLPSDSPLFDTPNLFITPHVLSDDIDQYVPRTLDIFFENIRRHLAGEPLRNAVDVQRGY